MEPNSNKKYRWLAFISYKREDEAWAKWLQHKLEHYKLPTAIRKAQSHLPKTAGPVFKDTTDLSGGVLEQAIKDALQNSQYLIVVCSPRAAQSPWVCKEVQEFIDSGREANIIPFIVDGEPFSTDSDKECFPAALRDLSGSRELLGININEMGRDAAAIKVAARMFHLRFDDLWQRYERELRNRRRLIVGLSLLGVILALSIAGIMFYQHRRMQINQARAVAYRATQLVESGDSYLARKLLLEVLPVKSDFIKYPYTPEAEAALRRANYSTSCVFKGHSNYVSSAKFNSDGTYIASASYDKTIRLWEVETAKCIRIFEGHTKWVSDVVFSNNSEFLLSASGDKTIRLWDVKSGECIRIFKGHTNYISSVIFSSDNKFILSSSGDKTIRLWDVNSGECLRIFKGHTFYISSANFSSDNNLIVSAAGDNTIRLWDVKSGDCIKVLKELHI